MPTGDTDSLPALVASAIVQWCPPSWVTSRPMEPHAYPSSESVNSNMEAHTGSGVDVAVCHVTPPFSVTTSCCATDSPVVSNSTNP